MERKHSVFNLWTRATTVLVTGFGNTQNLTSTTTDTTTTTPEIKIETCAQKNCGAFTISLTSANNTANVSTAIPIHEEDASRYDKRTS